MDLITRQRHERRAAVLAAAREMIAEFGYAGVTVRDLAERCGVSVPTLYNQFGDKDGVLSAAIEAHFLEVLSSTPMTAREPGYERLVIIIDQIAEQILTLSAYHRRLLEAFAAIRTTAPVQQRIAKQLAQTIEAELQIMANQRQLADWANPASVAGQMTTASIAAAVVWSSGMVPDDQFAATIQYATGLILLGIARGKARKALEVRVQAAQHILTQTPTTQASQLSN